VLSNIDYWLM